MAEKGRLGKWAMIGYGAGEFSSSIFWVSIAFWLMNYLTDVVGLSAGLAGLAILAGKGIDAFVDPGVGYLSDRTRSRLGRRRPWFLWSAVPFGAAFVLMFSKPSLSGQGALFAWTCLAFILLNVAYSCANVPYNSLLPELTEDYDQRSAVTGVKSVYAIVGALLGAGIAMPIIEAGGGGARGFTLMGASFGLLAAVGVLLPFFAVKETPSSGQAGADRPRQGILASNAAVLGNRPFRLALGAWTLNTCGVTVVTTSLVYYFKYVFGDSGLVTIASLVMLLSAMAFVPVVVKLSRRFGKRSTYFAGMLIVAASCVFLFLLGEALDEYGVFATMLVAGVGLSTHYVMPWAIVPDTIDHDYAETGIRREGAYYGLWTFMIKIGQALAAALVGGVLGLAGYRAGPAPGAEALLGIRLLVGPVPAAFFGLGLVCLALYPLDRKAYEELRARIDSRARP